MLVQVSKNHKGHIPWNKGKKGLYKLSEETKRKMSQSRKGRVMSEESRKKSSMTQKGRVLTEEHKIKISIANKGNKNSLGYKFSEEIRRKKSESLKGDKSNLWRGGVSPKNLLAKASIDYKLWREKVFERDNYTCQKCGARSGNGYTVYLNAHHIKPFFLYKELRFLVSNGITLCEKCHRKTDTFGTKALLKFNLWKGSCLNAGYSSKESLRA
jgi:hypothetical protein